jgi:hypothetical protein
MTAKQTYLLLCEKYGKEEMEKLIGLSRFIAETEKHGNIIKEIKQYFEIK